MAITCWINPNPASGGITARDRVFVDSAVMPVSSPAPAGNAVVPAGWVLQIETDGRVDTMLGDLRSGSLVYVANITQFVVPYYSGGWPPDPLIGQPGHTAQRGTGAG